VLLTVLRHAVGLVTDSGGIQEEATILKRRVLVIRRSNERPEVEHTFGSRTLPGQGINHIVTQWQSEATAANTQLADVPTPFCDGTGSSRLIDAIRSCSAALRARRTPASRSSEHRLRRPGRRSARRKAAQQDHPECGQPDRNADRKWY
jgi:UDP-N-acetylglucosamine 2-epimerase (non-hydrolysing)